VIDFFSEHWILSLLILAALGSLSSALVGLYYQARIRSAMKRWEYEEQERIDEQKKLHEWRP